MLKNYELQKRLNINDILYISKENFNMFNMSSYFRLFFNVEITYNDKFEFLGFKKCKNDNEIKGFDDFCYNCNGFYILKILGIEKKINICGSYIYYDKNNSYTNSTPFEIYQKYEFITKEEFLV